MANEYGTPVLFTKEKNVWILSARITFDGLGVPALDTANSKGFCAVWQNTPTFTAGTTNSSSVIGTVSSFQGLFSGMRINVGSSGAFVDQAVIGSITASGDTFKVTAANAAQAGFPVFAIPSTTFVAGSGGSGQYILQLGQQAATRLQTYYKLLGIHAHFDMTTGSMVGTAAVAQAAQQQQAPKAPTMLLIQDNTRVRTIPNTQATNSTDASITVQFGSGTAGNFQALAPAAGEAVRITLIMGNSSAP
jgi:hypothetical protein